jgi:hypothetical protein
MAAAMGPVASVSTMQCSPRAPVAAQSLLRRKYLIHTPG